MIQSILCENKIDLEVQLIENFIKVTKIIGSNSARLNTKINSITITSDNEQNILQMCEIVTELIQYEYISEEYVEALERINQDFHRSQIIKFKFKNTNLKEVHQKDIKPYPDLQILELKNNHIEVIEEDLFDENPNLINVNFQDNRIWFFDAYAVKKLKNLGSLSKLLLQNNVCINKDFKNPFNNDTELSEISEKCFKFSDRKLIELLSKESSNIGAQTLENLKTELIEVQRILSDNDNLHDSNWLILSLLGIIFLLIAAIIFMIIFIFKTKKKVKPFLTDTAKFNAFQTSPAVCFDDDAVNYEIPVIYDENVYAEIEMTR